MRVCFLFISVSVAALVGCSQPPLEGRYVGTDGQGYHVTLTLESGGSGVRGFESLNEPITDWYVIGDTVFVNTEPRILGTLDDTYENRLALVRAPEGLLVVTARTEGYTDAKLDRYLDTTIVFAETENATPGRQGILLHRQPD